MPRPKQGKAVLPAGVSECVSNTGSRACGGSNGLISGAACRFFQHITQGVINSSAAVFLESIDVGSVGSPAVPGWRAGSMLIKLIQYALTRATLDNSSLE